MTFLAYYWSHPHSRLIERCALSAPIGQNQQVHAQCSHCRDKRTKPPRKIAVFPSFAPYHRDGVSRRGSPSPTRGDPPTAPAAETMIHHKPRAQLPRSWMNRPGRPTSAGAHCPQATNVMNVTVSASGYTLRAPANETTPAQNIPASLSFQKEFMP